MKLVIVAIVVLAALLAWFLFGRTATVGSSAVSQAPVPAAKPASEEDLQAFLAPIQSRLDASRRPLRRIQLEALPGDDLDVSKVGGRAWWPKDEPPPLQVSGEGLVLLAQINFAEVPPMEGYPSEGLLQFYIPVSSDLYGANFDSASMSMEVLARQQEFRVVYWLDVDVPAVGLPVQRGDMTPHDPSKPRRMRFVADVEPISVADYRFDRFFEGGTYSAVEAFAQSRGIDVDGLADALWERHSGAGHKLGGYPYFTQTDPRSAGDWELLLQLDSDDEMMWGDVGVGGFFIAPEDLARGDFSRVAYSWDCH